MEDKPLTRPYKNQKQKDKELMLAYQKGCLDERKIWKEVKKENDILRFREKKIKSYCFCKGDKLWRSVCAECQSWFKKEVGRRIKIAEKESGKIINGGDWDGIKERILRYSFNVQIANDPKDREESHE